MKKFIILFAFVLGLFGINAVHSEDKSREERKIAEIGKIVKLTSKQKSALIKGYKEYLTALDSSVYLVNDAIQAVSIKYRANKVFHELLMNTLKEKQRIEYIQITSAPEIEEKTNYKLSLLSESGDYSDKELLKMKDEIFNYLMLEKVVYIRDKYNIQKQKENISRLKNVEPRCLKESNIREKQKGQGRLKKGNVQW